MNHNFSIFKKHINVSCETLEKLGIYSKLCVFGKNELG